MPHTKKEIEMGKITLEEAENILAAYAVGMFRGTVQEMLIAQKVVDNAIKEEQEEINEQR